jgi:hypothetical protein
MRFSNLNFKFQKGQRSSSSNFDDSVVGRDREERIENKSEKKNEATTTQRQRRNYEEKSD